MNDRHSDFRFEISNFNSEISNFCDFKHEVLGLKSEIGETEFGLQTCSQFCRATVLRNLLF